MTDIDAGMVYVVITELDTVQFEIQSWILRIPK